MAKMKDITGNKFGKLTAIKPVGKNKRGRYLWLCKCDCGGEKIVAQDSLHIGNTKSCGCAVANTKHGHSHTRMYKLWTDMKQRCYNPNTISYSYCGGRGIQVCDDWKNSFQSFADWAFSCGYGDNLTIDRIDNDKDYCPENCRWVTLQFQERNKRTTYFAEHHGEQIPVAILCEELNLPVQVIYHRVLRGSSLEEAVTKPINYRSKERIKKFNKCATKEEFENALLSLSSRGLL